MAQISQDLQHQLTLMAQNVPQEIRARIDVEEFKDRIAQAAGLIAKAGEAATPGERRQLSEHALRVLQARPRAETEAIVKGKIAKAKIIGNSVQEDALIRQARDELLAHPPAIRRHAAPVVKAASGPGDCTLVPLYDASGVLRWVGDPGDLTPVLPDPQATMTAKAQAAARDRFGEPPAPAEVQTRNTAPVRVGGTTGMGRPRLTGPPEALPDDGPQQVLPGDVPDRQVIKAASHSRQAARLLEYGRQLAAHQDPARPADGRR